MTNSLACYAVSEQSDRQRRFPEKPHRYRTAFERDRDRIIHCEAFRRLEGKTQVFAPGRNDNFRTRLTHSLEVAQVGRTIARVLRLNESLTEAICLAHDLGHSPFGHAGESVLNELMAGFGCFEHNRQTLRVVDILENPYPDFPGLNLMYQTRLGLAKHCSTYDKPDEPEFTEANCSLEGQVAGIADRIAYNCHDLEDGLRARIIHDEQLCNTAIFAKARAFIGADAISDYFVRRTRTAKAVLDILVSDCIETSQRTIESAGVSRPADVLSAAEAMVRFSVAIDGELAQLEKFLMDNMYRHPEMEQTALNVRTWISDVFGRLCAKPELMPRYYQKLIGVHGLQRTVCDYIAGMTDRYCLRLLKDI